MKQIVIRMMLILLMPSWIMLGTAYAEKINLYANDWPVNEFLRGMNKLGQLNEFNVQHDKFATCIYQLKKGQADMMAGLTLFEFIASQHEGANIVIIAVQDYSAGGDVIILRPEIKSASELKGKTIGVQADSLSIHLLHLYLEKNGMSLNNIKIADIPVENLGKAYISGKSLAGIVAWPPITDEAINAGGKIAASSKDFPEKIIDVFAVNRESLQKNRAVYKEFLKKWFAAVRNPAVLEKSAEELKVPSEEFKKWLECAYIYQDAASSLQMFPKAKEVTQEIQDFLKAKPVNIPAAAARLFGKEPLNADSWFDDSLLQELAKEQP
jgi:NitT/TauT family transport system substrate-binding protein